MSKKEIQTEERRKIKRIVCLFTIFGVIQFLILTFLAMFAYYPVIYSFTNNYFSDLGKTVIWTLTFDFRPIFVLNPISSNLWIITVIVTAISFVFFWIIFRTLYKETKIMTKISTLGTILGVISTAFFIGVAIFPVDIYGLAHLISGYGFFFIFAICIILYTIAIFLNEELFNLEIWKFRKKE
ncbi:MAG: hypothetical protein ACFFCM_07420, partial [Promethearchaeota archaeon]